MKTAIVVVALLGVCLAQKKPEAKSFFYHSMTQPAVYHMAEPTVYHVQQPAVYHMAQPTVFHMSQPAVYNMVQPSVRLVKPLTKMAVAGKPVAILKQSAAMNEDGTFNYDFQSEDGSMAEVRGSMKQISPTEDAQVMEGSFSYTAPDGTPIVTKYVADETGFHAYGDHLPTPPPIPEAIARSLEMQQQQGQEMPEVTIARKA